MLQESTTLFYITKKITIKIISTITHYESVNTRITLHNGLSSIHFWPNFSRVTRLRRHCSFVAMGRIPNNMVTTTMTLYGGRGHARASLFLLWAMI
jgi:hypothetical protein